MKTLIFLLGCLASCVSCTPFVVYSTYGNSNCTGTPIGTTAYGAACGIGFANTSYVYSCVNNEPVYTSYSSLTCQGPSTSLPFAVSCIPASGSTYGQATCLSSFSSNVLIQQTFNSLDCSGDWALAQWFNLSTCYSGTMYKCDNTITVSTDCKGNGASTLALQCTKFSDNSGSSKYISPCSPPPPGKMSDAGIIGASETNRIDHVIPLITFVVLLVVIFCQ